MQNQETIQFQDDQISGDMELEQKIVGEKELLEKENPYPVPNQLGNENVEKIKANIKPKISKKPHQSVYEVAPQQIFEYKPAEVNFLFQKQNLLNKEENYHRNNILQDLVAFWDLKKEDLHDQKFQQSNRKQDQYQEALLEYQQILSKHIQSVCGGEQIKSTNDEQLFASQIMKQINNYQIQQDQNQEVIDEENSKIQLLSQSLSNNRQDHQRIYFFRQEYLDKQSANYIIQLIRNNIKQFYNLLIIDKIKQFFILNNYEQNYEVNEVQTSQIKQSIVNFFFQVYNLNYNTNEAKLDIFIIEIFKHHFRNQNPQRYIQIFDRKYLSVKQNVDFLYQIIQKQEVQNQFNNPAIITQIEDFFLELNNDRQINYTDHSTIEQIKNKISQFFQDCFDIQKLEPQIETQIKAITKSGEINSSIAIQTFKEFIYEIFQRFFSFHCAQKHQPLKVKSTLSIRKLQNGNIIHSFENKQKLYCNYQFDHQLKILKRDGFNTEQVVYEGILDQYDQPHSRGVLENPQWKYEGQFHQGFFHGEGRFEYKGVYVIDGQFIDGNAEGDDCIQYFSKSDPSGKEFHIKGRFQRGLKQGSFQCSLINCQQLAFDNDKQIEVQKPQSKSYPFREYGNVGVQFIDQKCFETTLDTRWMQQKVVDFYLISLWSDLSLINDLSHINLINTCSAQDIFGSVIRQYNLNKEEIKRQIEEREKTNSIKRTIIALNMNQQHFMACVYENNKFYLLDSICGSNYPALLPKLPYSILNQTQYILPTKWL